MSMILLEDVLILARTVYGEARGEDDEGRRAVAHTPINRWKSRSGQFARDDTLATACLRHRQFSAWDAGTPAQARNLDRMLTVTLNDPVFRACLAAALKALNEPDFTGSAKHYHALSISPAWAKGHKPCFVTGNHAFYNDVK
ncbi:hypothetical protein LCGC14_0327850 [marine sediment metagenome]